MPREWNGKVVCTAEELIPAFWNSWDALRRRLDRDLNNPFGIRRAREGRGPGNSVLIDYDTLPMEMRNDLPDPRRRENILQKWYREEIETVTFYAGHRVGKRGTLPTGVQEEYVVNASVIRAAIELRKERMSELTKMRMGLKNFHKTILEDVTNFNVVLYKMRKMHHTLPTTERRLREKIDLFEREGYSSLIDGKWNNRNAAKRTERVERILEGLFARDKTKPSPTEVARRYDGFKSGYIELINPDTGEMHNPSEFPHLSDRTITGFLTGWESKVATYKLRSGDRQLYMSEFESYVSLKHPEWAGSIISIDDRQPPFYYNKERDRVWFYVGIDLGSEAWTVWVYGKKKEGIIVDFYREMIRNYTEWGLNIPAELECEMSLNSSFRETFLQEGRMFEHVRIEANNARGKRVEQFFRQVRYGNEKGREGWLGRPYARSEANQKRPEFKVIPYDTIVGNSLKDIETWNNSPHSIHTDKTRWEVLLEHQHPDLKPTNWHGILPYLGYQTKGTVRAGNVKFDNRMFLLGWDEEIKTGEELIDLMEVCERQQLEIYWLDGHEGQVLKALGYIGGRCVCELIEKPIVSRARIEQTEEDRKNMEVVSRYNNTIRGYANRRKNSIEEVVFIDNRPQTLNNKFQIRGMKKQEQEDEDLNSIQMMFEKHSKSVALIEEDTMYNEY